MVKKVRKSNVDPARRLGYRSGLEEKIAANLKQRGVVVGYETTKISYVVHETRTYTPDWQLPNGVIVESKGRFTLEDRKKHLLIQRQHPFLDIRFVFQNSKNVIRKGSKTTYADWCIKNGFLYADKEIPDEWLRS